MAGQQYTYAYDDLGNRIGSGEGGTEDPTVPLRMTGYTVNLLNQLTGRVNPSAAEVLGAANAQAEVRVNGLPAYRRGEYFRRELAVTNASGPAWTPVSVSAMQSGTTNTTGGNLHSPPVNETLVYDADGNLLHDGLWVYQWDAENRLLSVTSTNTVPSAGRRQVPWAYDAGGRRVRQTQAIWSGSAYTNAVDQKLLHDGWACVAELSSTNSLQRQYIWGLDLSGTMTEAGGVGGLLWMLPSWGGAGRFAVYDGNGNVTGLVQNNGQFRAWYEYDPFGRTIRETVEDGTTAQNPYRFSTKRAVPYTGLILYEYRIYDPVAGRWPNRDPIEEQGGMNLYGFVYNNPIGFVDTDGRALWGWPVVPPPGVPPTFPPPNWQPPVGPPSVPLPPPDFGESLIPVYGSILQAEYNFSHGNEFLGTFYSALSVSDVFLVRSLATGLGKGCWKVGSHSWSATRSWYGRTRELFKNQEVHHGILNQNQGIGKWFPEWFKNQPWNLRAVPEVVKDGVRYSSKDVHLAIHGKSRKLTLNWVERAWYGTPIWIGEVGAYFGLRAETVFEEDCTCSAKHAGKTVIKEGNNEVVLP